MSSTQNMGHTITIWGQPTKTQREEQERKSQEPKGVRNWHLETWGARRALALVDRGRENIEYYDPPAYIPKAPARRQTNEPPPSTLQPCRLPHARQEDIDCVIQAARKRAEAKRTWKHRASTEETELSVTHTKTSPSRTVDDYEEDFEIGAGTAFPGIGTEGSPSVAEPADSGAGPVQVRFKEKFDDELDFDDGAAQAVGEPAQQSLPADINLVDFGGSWSQVAKLTPSN